MAVSMFMHLDRAAGKRYHERARPILFGNKTKEHKTQTQQKQPLTNMGVVREEKNKEKAKRPCRRQAQP